MSGPVVVRCSHCELVPYLRDKSGCARSEGWLGPRRCGGRGVKAPPRPTSQRRRYEASLDSRAQPGSAESEPATADAADLWVQWEPEIEGRAGMGSETRAAWPGARNQRLVPSRALRTSLGVMWIALGAGRPRNPLKTLLDVR
jgi:hypothetical protein